MLESAAWPGLVRPHLLRPLPWKSPTPGQLSMSDHDRTTTIPAESAKDEGAQVVEFPSARTRTRKGPRLRLWRRRKRPKRFRIRKLRVLMLLFGLGLLAAVSCAFGLFMALVS